MTPLLAGSVAGALYLFAAERFMRGLVSTDRPTVPQKYRNLLLGGIALLIHALILYQFIHTADGLNLGFFHSLSLIAWLIALFVVIGALRGPLENLTIILFPIAAVSLLLQLTLPSSRILEDATVGLQAHILLSLCAYSLLGVAAAQALVLAVQERQLRHKHPGAIMRALPPLQVMENLLFQLITIGFFLLSLSIATGFMFLHDPFAQHLLHKTVLSMMAWIFFAILLWGRWARGWRGRVAIRWTLGAFACLMLAYFGSKMALELILNRV